MKTSQKIGIGAFLCLSVAMVVVALARLIGSVVNTKNNGFGTNPTYGTLMMCVEGSIAVIMSSVMVFRRFFLKRETDNAAQIQWNPFTRARTYLSFIFRSSRSKSAEQADSGATEETKAARIPTMHVTGWSLGTLKSLFSLSRSEESKTETMQSESQLQE